MPFGHPTVFGTERRTRDELLIARKKGSHVMRHLNQYGWTFTACLQWVRSFVGVFVRVSRLRRYDAMHEFNMKTGTQLTGDAPASYVFLKSHLHCALCIVHLSSDSYPIFISLPSSFSFVFSSVFIALHNFNTTLRLTHYHRHFASLLSFTL